jgi:hypothetical protein
MLLRPNAKTTSSRELLDFRANISHGSAITNFSLPFTLFATPLRAGTVEILRILSQRL